MSDDLVADVLAAMVLAGYEVTITFDTLAWSRGDHGIRLVEAVFRSWGAIRQPGGISETNMS